MARLTTDQLVKRMLVDQREHRIVIERWLNMKIEQPDCGCAVRWRWVWQGHDWIMPLSVAVFCAACQDHDDDEADEIIEHYVKGLTERLEWCRRQTGNE